MRLLTIETLITILTPTYNRAKTLPRLYESLLKQTSKNFEWLIVDDGSTDSTQEVVYKFKNDEKIKLNFYRKENGGKHTALNFGIKKINSELTFIVDSDDYLTYDAIETIEKEWELYSNQEGVCGICFLKGKSQKEYIGDLFPDEKLASYIDVRLRKKIRGDKAEIFKTKLLKSKIFPEIPGEKFIGEDYVWCDLGKNYLMVWTNKIIYICEYLNGGLSLSGRKLRINCPIGGMLNSEMMLTKEFPLYFRLKKAILYNCYYLFADKNKCLQNYTNSNLIIKIITYPIGLILYLYWKKKYVKN